MEFALLLPLFLLLVLGSIDWGYYFYVHQVVTNAAREGARAGAVENDQDDCVTEATAAVQRALSGGRLNPNPTPAPYISCVEDLVAPGTCPKVIRNGAAVPAVCVEVSYPVGSITGWLNIAGTNLIPDYAYSKAIMRAEGDW